MAFTASKTTWSALVGFTLYFGFFLVPKIAPGFAGSTFAFLLTLSMLLIIPILVLFAIWSGVALARERLQNKPMSRFSRAAGQIAWIGIIICVITLILGNLLPNSLPSGSYDRTFDRAAWLAPTATRYIKGSITPRQKMLADVVSKLPGKNRLQLEKILGPSLDTDYFKESGRDLIYLTGPQRDSFLAMDSEWLLVWLDEKGTYKRHKIVTD